MVDTRADWVKRILWVVVAALAVASVMPRVGAQSSSMAITGATLIDGSGGPAVPDAVIVVTDGRIAVSGPRASVRVCISGREWTSRSSGHATRA